MEKILKLLPQLLNATSPKQVADLVHNPDTFTLHVIEQDSSTSFTRIFSKFSHDKDLEEILSKIPNNASLNEIVSVLKESGNDQLVSVANFIENDLQKIDGINLEGKSVVAVLWSAVVYSYLKDDRTHLGVNTLEDIYEQLPLCFMQCHSEVANSTTVESARNEVLSIFQNTDLTPNIEQYFSKGFIQSRFWINRASSWIDGKTLEPMQLEENDVVIDSPESLLEALKTPSESVYQKAIDYVTNTYFQNESADYIVPSKLLTLYKAHMTVALLAAEVVSEDDSKDFSNIALNLISKITSYKNKLEYYLDRGSYLSGATNIKGKSIESFIESSQFVALSILGKASLITDDEPVDEKKKPNIAKVGNRKTYIASYLKMFRSIITTRINYCDKQLEQLEKIMKKNKITKKDEDFVLQLAEEFKVNHLITSDLMPNNAERASANAELVYKAVLKKYQSLYNLLPVFDEFKKTYAENLDIENLTFDRNLIKASKRLLDNDHELIIKEFYRLLAADPMLKNSQPTYRLLKTDKQRLVELRERANADPDNFKFFSGLIKAPAKKDVAEKTAYELYVSQDGTVNEKFEELYTVITGKTTIEEKREALAKASQEGIINAQQEQVIADYITELEEKEAKKIAREEERRKKEEAKKLQGEQQSLFDFVRPSPDDTNSSDDENANE